MDLSDILSPELITPELKATNRWEAIEELVNVLVACNKIKSEHRDEVISVVKKRESSMSTGIGFGVGIPHTSTDLIHWEKYPANPLVPCEQNVSSGIVVEVGH